jgi:hypothetical protein
MGELLIALRPLPPRTFPPGRPRFCGAGEGKLSSVVSTTDPTTACCYVVCWRSQAASSRSVAATSLTATGSSAQPWPVVVLTWKRITLEPSAASISSAQAARRSSGGLGESWPDMGATGATCSALRRERLLRRMCSLFLKLTPAFMQWPPLRRCHRSGVRRDSRLWVQSVPLRLALTLWPLFTTSSFWCSTSDDTGPFHPVQPLPTSVSFR